MEISCSALYLALTIILNTIGLSSQTTLGELFPGSDGTVLPPVETCQYQDNAEYQELRKMVHRVVTKFNASSTLLKRGHVIFGWSSHQVIKPIFSAAGEPNNVYDIINKEFVRLTNEELEQMGIGCFLKHLQNQQQTVERARQAAHQEATGIANLQAAFQLHLQQSPRANTQSNHQVNHEASVQAIYQTYHASYNEAYNSVP